MKHTLLIAAIGLALLTSCGKKTNEVPVIKLNNGLEMPAFGIGTYNFMGNNAACKEAVLYALKHGYRHIDTAHAYEDEEGVGQAIEESGIPREEIWVTSKLLPTDYQDGNTLQHIDEMLERLGLDYVDLLYIHMPFGKFTEAWKDMEKAVEMGKVRTLGLSNFESVRGAIDEVMAVATIKPAIIQMECHPYAQRLEARKKVNDLGMAVECWFPLGGAMSQGALFKDPVLQKIGQAHGKTAAQVILRWEIQEGFSTIPGSGNPAHIDENFNIFDFELSDAEMAEIRSLNKEQRFFTVDYEEAREQFDQMMNAQMNEEEQTVN